MSGRARAGRKLLAGWAPVALAAVAAGGLGVLFLEARGPLPQLAPPGRDPLAAAYLRAQVRDRPGDAALRLRLSREELALGRWGEADRALAPLLEGTAPSKEARWLSLEIALAAWRAAPAAAPDRVLSRLERAAGPEAPVDDLARAAEVARGLGRPDLAARAGQRAASLDPRGCARWEAEAARDFLAAGDPGSAASSAVRAWTCAGGGAEGRALGLVALEALVAADRGARALALAEVLAGRHPSDRRVLEGAERIALAQGDAVRARRFAARLCGLGAADRDRLHRLLDLHLAAGDLGGASEVAEQLARRAPADPGARLTAARAAEWAGRPLLALGHWLWLARHRGGPGDVEGALRLARAIPDHEVLAELLLRQSRGQALAPAALRELAFALDHSGPRQAAVAALADHAARHQDSRAAWEELAAFQERRGELAGALATRAEIASRFGASLEASLQVARLHWAQGQPGRALADLAAWTDSADLAAADYWSLLAELAWNQESDRLATRAYRALWDGKRIDVTGAERLLLLAREAGRTDEVIRLGREGWTRFGEPRLLLLAMDEAARARRQDDLSTLAGTAAGARAAFSRFPAYWLLLAQRDGRSGRTAEAVEDYRRALEADPEDAEIRAGLIWLLVDAGDREALSRWLSAWEAEAPEEPALWRPYAAGLDLLGRREEALAFLARQVSADPADTEARTRYLAAMAAATAPPRPAATLRAELAVQTLGPATLRRAEAGTGTWIGGAEVGLRAAVADVASGAPAAPSRRTLEVRAGLAWEGLGGRTELSGGVGVKPDRIAPLGTVAHTRRLAPFAEVRVEAAANERAPESAELLAGGWRDRAGASLTVTAGQAYGRGAAEWMGWRWDSGATLGRGGTGTLELGWRAPATEPELTLRAQAAYHRSWLMEGAPGAPPLPGELLTLGVGASAARWRAGPALLSVDGWLGWLSNPGRPAYRLQAGVSVAPAGAAHLFLGAYTANDRWGTGAGDFGLTASLTYELPPPSAPREP